MPRYRFVVFTATGSRVEAESEADSREELCSRLEGRGLTVDKIDCLDDGDAEPLIDGVFEEAAEPVDVTDEIEPSDEMEPEEVAEPVQPARPPKPVQSAGAPKIGAARLAASVAQSQSTPGDQPVRTRRGLIETVVAAVLLVVAAGMIVWITPSALATEDGSAWSGSHLIFGTAWTVGLFSVFFLLGKWFRRAALRPLAKDAFRSPPLGWTLRGLGLGLVVLGWLFPEEFLTHTAGSKAAASTTLLNVTTLVAAYLGAVLVHAGYRLGLRGRKQKRTDDTRESILYLRSFGDDGSQNLNPDGWLAKALGLRPFDLLDRFGPIAHLYPLRMLKLLCGVAADTVEEQLGAYFRRLGPFVAVVKPGEMTTDGEDEQLDVELCEWQQRMVGLMDCSRLVILQPTTSEGAMWEIGQAMELDGPRRLLISLANFERDPQAFAAFARRLAALTGGAPPAVPEDAHFLCFGDDWQPQLLTSVRHAPLRWPLRKLALDLPRTLLPFLSRLPKPPEDLPKEATPTRMPAWLSAATAIILWNVLPLALLLGGKSALERPGTLTASKNDHRVETKEGKEVDYQSATIDQALARHSAITHASKAAEHPYRFHLGPGWKPDFGSDASCLFSFRDERQVVVGLTVLRKNPGELDPDVGAARTMFESLVYGQKPEGEDARTWLQHQQKERPILQWPSTMRGERQWTIFECLDRENDRVWRAEFTDGVGCGYLVFGWSPVADEGGKMRKLADTALNDFELPPPAAKDERARSAARLATWRDALHDPGAIVSKGTEPAFTVGLGRGWRELPLEGSDRRFLLHNDASLTFQVRSFPPATAEADVRRLFLAEIGREDKPDWPIAESSVTRKDGQVWKEWRAETEDHGAHVRWRGQWFSDEGGSYLLLSRTWPQTPELDALGTQLLDQAFAHFATAPGRPVEYQGVACRYVFRLPGSWKPIDLTAKGYDRAWEGPDDMLLRVEASSGAFSPDRLPAAVAAVRDNLGKQARLGASVSTGPWTRFRADMDVDGKSYSYFFSLALTTDARYIVSIIVPTANLVRCEPSLTEALGSIELP